MKELRGTGSPTLLGALMATCCLMLSPAAPARGVSPDPSASVFLLLTVMRNPLGQYVAIGRGSAFFIAPGGVALTNGSVVYSALADPKGHQLLAIVGGESYSATIVCAIPPPYNPVEPHPFGVPWSRDLAEIALTDLALPSEIEQVSLPGGPVFTLPPAHRGELPAFPPLEFGPDPRRGDAVDVVWIDRLQPIPTTAEATGTVEDTSTASAVFQSIDFTPIFSVALSSQTVTGNSGAPVLNPQNQVVGIWSWYSLRSASHGIAISSSALIHVCP